MKEYINASALENLTLGKTTTYKSAYDASILQGVPRSLNRDGLDIGQSELPFFGEDVWYGYEVSWLNSKGKPVVAIAEFRVPCISENIIESKSFKLYLNSYNQTKFSNHEEVKKRLTDDLSLIAKANVNVTLFPVDDCPALIVDQYNDIWVSGVTYSNDLPTLNSGGFFQASNNGFSDCFLAKFNNLGENISSTYIGGNKNEYHESSNTLAIDACNNLYFAFETRSYTLGLLNPPGNCHYYDNNYQHNPK